MTRRRDTKEERSALRRLEDVPAGEAEPALACALQDSVAGVAERAAEVATHHSLRQLTPLILEAFERFLTGSHEADPQCSAKIALATALAAFEHPDPKPYLAGMRQICWAQSCNLPLADAQRTDCGALGAKLCGALYELRPVAVLSR